MESAKTALKNFAAKVGEKSYRLGLKWLRYLIDCADDWCHAQEVKLRDEAARPAYLAEVDPVASAAREKRNKTQVQKIGNALPEGLRAAGAPRSPQRGRRALPRLKYQHGEFVRTA